MILSVWWKHIWSIKTDTWTSQKPAEGYSVLDPCHNIWLKLYSAHFEMYNIHHEGVVLCDIIRYTQRTYFDTQFTLL
jgi:hypothetical protein